MLRLSLKQACGKRAESLLAANGIRFTSLAKDFRHYCTEEICVKNYTCALCPFHDPHYQSLTVNRSTACVHVCVFLYVCM